MSLPRYAKYKDSGVEWLSEVPEHWDVLKLARTFRAIGSGTTPQSGVSEYYDDGHIPWVNTGDLNDSFIIDEPQKVTEAALRDYTSLKLHPTRSVVMAMYGATIGKLGFLTFPATVNQACCVLNDSTEVHNRYLFYWLLGLRQQIVSMATGSGQPNISQNLIRTLQISCPSPSDQQTIVAFLDSETAKIDALVEEQRRLIELLKEKRQAVISHAVTKGLNSNAPIKPSGVEWLGDVPEHWELMASKRLFRLVAEPAPDDNDHELLSIYTEIGVRPRKDLAAKGNKATTTDGYWMVRKGDLIVNKLLAWMGAIGVSNYDGVTSPAYDILRQRVKLEPQFYDYLFRCGICFTEFRRYSRGIMDMRLRLYFDELGQLIMPYPPLSEQQVIVSYLNEKLATFDDLTKEANRAIGLLQERRSALISAAVTGKIDVSGLAKEDAA